MARAAMGGRMDSIQTIHDRLLARYGPQHWWPAETPFEVIVGALLMPQTAWKNVAEAIQNLKDAHLLEVRALASVSIPILRKHVRVAGLFRSKPGRLRAFCRHLLERANGDLDRYFNRPTDEVRTDLLAQDGVGPETADSILLYAGGHPIFLVDAYTVRIGQRVGLFETGKYPEVQRYFEERLPPDLPMYQEFHALLVRHATTLCRPNPKCDPCPLRDRCKYGRVGPTSNIVK